MDFLRNMPIEFWRDVTVVILSVIGGVCISFFVLMRMLGPRLKSIEQKLLLRDKISAQKIDLFDVERNFFKRLKNGKMGL